jgi:uncharacterized damage-inducible protein DinB
MNSRYPIGTFQEQEEVTSVQIQSWIEELTSIPESLGHLVRHLSEEQLDTTYREGGWAIKQVVHHIADALMNSYIHFKLALTEDNPIIKPYDEERWAALEDEKNGNIEISLSLLQSIMERWGLLLRSMAEADFKNTFVHPVSGQKRLDKYLGFCVWHGQHHIAQIKTAVDRIIK